MPSFDTELRACLGEILGERPPDPDTDSLLFFGQWLAERNLGLVPIARASAFSWPGSWLARVRATDGDHAVVMFGSPSGALFDPAGSLAAGGAIEEGWLVAPLDPWLDAERPYGVEARPGVVAALLVAPEAEAPLVPVDSAVAIAGRGPEGDRYAAGRGTRRHPRHPAQPARRSQIPHRRRGVRWTTVGRAVRAPRESVWLRTAPPARPPRRPARGHSPRRHDPAGRRARTARLIYRGASSLTSS
jgi:hypothetical protein